MSAPKISHHPSIGLLRAVAAGDASPGVLHTVTAHALRCAECGRALGELEAIGGAMLEAELGIKMSDSALERALARIDAEGLALAVSREEPAWLARMPDALKARALAALKTPGWRAVATGFSTLDLKSDDKSDTESVGILRIEPGHRVPRHGHDGRELILVLTGAFRDERGAFYPGDLAVNDARHTHSPLAEPGDTCLALVVTAAPPKFTGAIGVLQRLTQWGRE